MNRCSRKRAKYRNKKKIRSQTIAEIKSHNSFSLQRICGLFDVSRQSYYKYKKVVKKLRKEENYILEEVMKIRKDHPKMGGRKLYYLIKPLMGKLNIKLGRDKFFDILSKHNMLIKRRIRSIRTIYSNHWYRKYPNLIKEKEIDYANQVWVSDITYWRIGEVFIFVTLITDMYSKKILGYSVTEQMKTSDILPALEMALKNQKGPSMDLIHHSDRGCQYCSQEYVSLLEKSKIKISMTESGDPLDNALAERMNGIMKTEYLKNIKVKNIKEARLALSKSVKLYNESRPHLSCDYHTPSEIYEGKFPAKKVWKNYYKNTTVNLLQDERKVVNL
ncbi:MAG: IS3 family transposase [Bacteroidetes bacterium]|nr:IS3 family transposase [Bacteroidota bacterium]